MIVQHNMAALNANRMLGAAGGILGKSTEKLASGYRINRAADDAAGLAISEKMRGQIRGLNRASSNAQDGISLIQTAEGALNETQNILQRMRELTVQAANETNTEDDRKEIQKEVNQLTSEINRIGNTTEYNTMKLLKGNTNEAVSKDMNVATLQDAEVVLAEGSVSGLNVKQASTIGKASVTTIQGNSSKTAAAFKDPKLAVAGVAGQKSTTTFAGLTFTANDTGEAMNGLKIEIKYDSTKNASAMTHTGTAAGDTLTLTLGTDDMDEILATGEEQMAAVLMSKLNSMNNGSDTLASLNLTIDLPEDEATKNNVSLAVEQLKAGNTKSSEMGNGKDAVAAQYKIGIEGMAKEADDTITIAGTTLLMTKGATSGTSSDGKVSLNDAGFYKEFAEEFNAANEKFDMSFIKADGSTVTAGGASALGATEKGLTIVLTEKNSTASHAGADYQGKTKLSDINVQAKGAGTDDILTISDKGGQNLVQFKFESAASSAGALGVAVAGTTANGNVTVTVTLAGAKGQNTAEAIQEAIQGLSNHAASGIDFREFEASSTGNWDIVTGGDTSTQDANNFTTAWNSTAGGVQTKEGVYSFDITNSFAEGDVLTVGGKTFVAAKDASIKDGVFATGVSTKEQADNIAAALKASNLTDIYDIGVNGTKITLTEIKASGQNLADPKVTDGASVKGEFSTKVDEVLKDGASLVIDGETISVSSKNAHVGYDNGTAIKATETLEDQNQALADAINKNANLSEKYTASIGDDGSLKLTQKVASENAPTLNVTGSTKGDFQLKLQIGANTGQSMTIEIGDTRALALGVAGDGSVSTVKANNGSVASYVEIANVNSGSDNENVEYALDLSNHDKATNALSVLDDALNYISSQRSSLGAYQNRLEYTISNLDNTAENLQTAESNIRDVNMAAEMVNYSKSNIIQQAAQSMLAQANQQTQGVLSLLR